jgi:putative glutamine amidotransferase
MRDAAISRPIIGLTPDIGADMAAETEYSIRRNYSDAILAAGGLPVILPYGHATTDYLALLDGLIITGGFFDIDPSLYDQPAQKPLVTKADRTEFEKTLIDGAIASNLPLLGICNGMQLLAVCLGGQLVQDLPSAVPDGLNHKPDTPASSRHHPIRVTRGTDWIPSPDSSLFRVNSLHHQAVLSSPAYRTIAVAEDGVIEAIESVGHSFAVGVQWHPEYMLSPIDGFVLEGLLAAARCYRSARSQVGHDG